MYITQYVNDPRCLMYPHYEANKLHYHSQRIKGVSIYEHTYTWRVITITWVFLEQIIKRQCQLIGVSVSYLVSISSFGSVSAVLSQRQPFRVSF